ncbi:MAG: alpha/beta hydrolase [SAR324 cluster bacterium]|nr:alpha/beta hydrolase [SAR324 cluster bacterium]
MNSKLDTQAAQWLHEMSLQGQPSFTEMTAQEVRESANRKSLERPVIREDVQQIQNLKVPINSKDILVRVYQPVLDSLAPLLLYFHGGGWVAGSLDTHDPLCRALANSSGFVVVSVDYPLSPETKFPKALHEGYEVLQWLLSNGKSIKGNPDWIAVGGDSAGGNLAASLALFAKREGDPSLKFQLLNYPITDISNFDTASYEELADGYGLTKKQMQWYSEQYLKNPKDGFNSLASPLLGEDLAGLPAAHVTIAEFDVLRDEGQAYADKLKKAGVSVSSKFYPGMTHGFLGMLGIFDRTRIAIDDIAFSLRNAYQSTGNSNAADKEK